ncbi:MAG: hypothetical protein ACTSRI_19640 [Promethearchaeota archaeon]
MPLSPEHIKNFLENNANDKSSSELINLLIKRINNLCHDCESDRIQCTLQPLCSRRFLLKLRVKNGLTLEDLPRFCYSVQKNIILRDFRKKTVVYRPNDVYLYLIDFLDIFFHGDYRKLNKFISFKNWDDVLKIFKDRIENRNEDFKFKQTDNFITFKYGERIHVIYINENYVLCNANRESIDNLELLKSLCELYKNIYFPDVKIKLIPSQFVELSIIMTGDVISRIKNTLPLDNDSKLDHYFWETFPNDLDALTQLCKEIHLNLDYNNNLTIKLDIGIESNNYSESEGKKINKLRFRDLNLIKNFIYRLYNEFYIIWL